MSPEEYKYLHEFNAEILATVEAFAEAHHGGQYTTARVVGGGWVGCFGPAAGLTCTRTAALAETSPDLHPPMPSQEALLVAMATVPLLYQPRREVLPSGAFFINSLVSEAELHAAAFHQGYYCILRTEQGQYIGAFGDAAHTSGAQRRRWLSYPTLETLFAMMLQYPDEHTTAGASAAFLESLS